MKIIAHRAKFKYWELVTENNPYQAAWLVDMGLDIELDIWMVENELWLGHDLPQYKINENFILHVSKFAWFHCKNFEALDFFSNNFSNLNYFWHENDDYTITSNGFIWTNVGKYVGPKSILVFPEKTFNTDTLKEDVERLAPYGICTDHPEIFI